eukprot:TRINITY_DN39806_c0_g1_i1.p1 TRINITY_DN39806_c0_g1~~TRINITY_DN39806_c0_g1_i1.p1  ORF type:complete len:679 (-),score=63.36 TRINITY_DN39806_c0_g1_i1:17-1759(-)
MVFAPGNLQDWFLSEKMCNVSELSGASCRDVKVGVRELARPLGIAMSEQSGRTFDIIGIWSALFGVVTLLLWLVVIIHDCVLINHSDEVTPFVLDVTGINHRWPCIGSVWKYVACLDPLTDILHNACGRTQEHEWGHGRGRICCWLVAFPMVPILLVWNLVSVILMNMVLLLAWLRAPRTLSRAMVFLTSVACSLYGLALASWSLAFAFDPHLRPRYALTWQQEGILPQTSATSSSSGTTMCTCGCDYSISAGVCLNLANIGALTTVKAFFIAFRCLKGLRRSNWANLLTVQFPVPLNVYAVDWRTKQNKIIDYRKEGMKVQEEVAFDPYAMMDEQLESADAFLKVEPTWREPLPKTCQSGEGFAGKATGARGRSSTFVCDGAGDRTEIGCCGFPWPKKGVSKAVRIDVDAGQDELEKELEEATRLVTESLNDFSSTLTSTPKGRPRALTGRNQAFNFSSEPSPSTPSATRIGDVTTDGSIANVSPASGSIAKLSPSQGATAIPSQQSGASPTREGLGTGQITVDMPPPGKASVEEMHFDELARIARAQSLPPAISSSRSASARFTVDGEIEKPTAAFSL